MSEINIYCDESCHLETDGQPIMVIGAVWCPTSEVRRISRELRELKSTYQARGELKWIKISKARHAFYKALIEYFFAEAALNFRCLVVEDKKRLNHEYFNQGRHDTFYYKMYYYMLRNILLRTNKYNIYLDIKDTRSAQKVRELSEILCNTVYDFTGEMISRIQNIRSHESEILQLADLLIGAVGYKNRELSGNSAKEAVVAQIMGRVGHDLCVSTPPWQEKFNLFVFTPTGIKDE